MNNIVFKGSAGRLEGRFCWSGSNVSPVVLMMHYKLKSNCVNDKLSYAVSKSFLESGFSTFFLNFRGVGMSEGVFSGGNGELSDATAAINWIRYAMPSCKDIWVYGFSFGAWVAIQLLVRRPEIKGFVVINPPTNAYDFSFLSPCPASGLVIRGKNDESAIETDNMVEKLSKQMHVKIKYIIEDEYNNFENSIEKIEESIKNYLISRITTKKKKVV